MGSMTDIRYINPHMVYKDRNGRVYFVHRAMDACFEVIRRDSMNSAAPSEVISERASRAAAQHDLDELANNDPDRMIRCPQLIGRVA